MLFVEVVSMSELSWLESVLKSILCSLLSVISIHLCMLHALGGTLTGLLQRVLTARGGTSSVRLASIADASVLATSSPTLK